MPEVICSNCGGDTNTAVSETDFANYPSTKWCYGRFVDGKWVKGCKFDGGDEMTKAFVLRLIGEDKQS